MIVLDKSKYKLAIILIILVLIAPIISVGFQLSSYSSVLLLSVFFIPFFSSNKIYFPKTNKYFYFYLSFSFFEIIKSIYFQSSTLSVLSVLIGFFIISIISKNIYYKSVNEKFEENMKIVFYFIFSLVVLSFYNINFGDYSNFSKSLFPFKEPGHFALYLGYFFPLAFYFCKNFTTKFLLFILLGYFSLNSESFLLVIMTVLSLLISNYDSKKNLIYVFISIFVGVLVIVQYSLFDLEYYLARLNFEGTRNLSSLSYLQGWDIIITTLNSTNLFGVGLNNLESVKPGEFSEIIYDISGKYFNRNDGGFLAAKVIGELGWFGVLVLFMYLKFVISKLKYLSKAYSSLQYFYSSVLIISLIEFFIRGLGYFTIGTILITSSFIYFKTHDKYYSS